MSGLGGQVNGSAGGFFDRSCGIGGSDIAAVLGMSPFRSAVEVWAEKVGGSLGAGASSESAGGAGNGCKNEVVSGCVAASASSGWQSLLGAISVGVCGQGSEGCEAGICDDGPVSLPMRFGHHLEPFVAQEYERVTGFVTHEYPQTITHPKYPHLYAHVDRLVGVRGERVVGAGGQICTDTLLECKTASPFNAWQWGQPWTDQVPPAYLLQCLWYTTLTGCKNVHLAVLLGNTDLRVYRVTHDADLGQRLVQAALNFWDDHVMSGIAPEPKTRSDALKVYPKEQVGLSVEADQATISRIRCLGRVQRLKQKLQAKEESLKDEIALGMRDAERICSNGKTLATWRSVAPSRRVDLARLRRERPEIAGEYLIESATARRLVITGATNG